MYKFHKYVFVTYILLRFYSKAEALKCKTFQGEEEEDCTKNSLTTRACYVQVNGTNKFGGCVQEGSLMQKECKRLNLSDYSKSSRYCYTCNTTSLCNANLYFSKILRQDRMVSQSHCYECNSSLREDCKGGKALTIQCKLPNARCYHKFEPTSKRFLKGCFDEKGFAQVLDCDPEYCSGCGGFGEDKDELCNDSDFKWIPPTEAEENHANNPNLPETTTETEETTTEETVTKANIHNKPLDETPEDWPENRELKEPVLMCHSCMGKQCSDQKYWGVKYCWRSKKQSCYSSIYKAKSSNKPSMPKGYEISHFFGEFRGCLVTSFACMEQDFGAQLPNYIKVTNCRICDTDFCNEDITSSNSVNKCSLNLLVALYVMLHFFK